jgi:hypothetical protein
LVREGFDRREVEGVNQLISGGKLIRWTGDHNRCALSWIRTRNRLNDRRGSPRELKELDRPNGTNDFAEALATKDSPELEESRVHLFLRLPSGHATFNRSCQFSQSVVQCLTRVAEPGLEVRYRCVTEKNLL